MKRKIFIIMISLSIILLSGCGKKLPEPSSNPIIFTASEIYSPKDDTPYKTIENNGDFYVAYGTISPRGLTGDITYAVGNYLGFLENNTAIKIYALNGESTDKWIIEYYENDPVIYREISDRSTSIPDSVKSFNYEYWS